MDPVMAERFRLIHRDGRLNKVEVLDAEDNVLCQLPLTGIEQREEIRERGETRLLVRSDRITFEEVPITR